ncbi:MAG: Rieske 2Fe-2S domain-containing protein [Streptosporangiaceae bacterium]
MYPHEYDMLERLWFPVARESDVDDAPWATSFLGHRLVLFRSECGLTAARDQCPHRGARLSLGQIRDGNLECPYHGWRFGHDGSCVLVPSQPSAHPMASLQTLPVRAAYGLVWVCLREPWLPMPSIPELADDPRDDWKIGYGTPFDVRCGLRSITENFRDSSHFAFVHKKAFGDVTPLIPRYEVRRDGWTLAWEFVLRYAQEWQADEGAAAGSRYRFGGTDVDQADPSVAMEQLIHYRFSAISVSYVYTEHPHGGRRIVCQAPAPIAADGTQCRVFFFVAANRAFREHYSDVATQVELESSIFAEDGPIVESLDPTEAPLELDSQAHVRADRYAVAYRRLYRDLLDEFAAAQPAVPAEAAMLVTVADGGPRRPAI